MTFDALGFAFDIATDHAALAAYIERTFAALASTRPARHHYVVGAIGESEESRYALSLDGERVATAPVAESLVATLVHDVSRRAVDRCPDLMLHAGGVERDGVGVALPGAQEAGKTTLTAGLVRAGFAYLTDEALAIDRAHQVVHPYPKPLSIDPGAWPLFSELEPHADLATDGYKEQQWQVPVDAIRPDALGAPCRIDAVVFPRHEPGAATVLEPVGRGEALVELTKNTVTFDQQGRAALDVLAEIVRGAVCHRLTTGDLDGAVEAVSSVVGVSRPTVPVLSEARPGPPAAT